MGGEEISRLLTSGWRTRVTGHIVNACFEAPSDNSIPGSLVDLEIFKHVDKAQTSRIQP